MAKKKIPYVDSDGNWCVSCSLLVSFLVSFSVFIQCHPICLLSPLGSNL